jgi:hypothetical protein
LFFEEKKIHYAIRITRHCLKTKLGGVRKCLNKKNCTLHYHGCTFKFKAGTDLGFFFREWGCSDPVKKVHSIFFSLHKSKAKTSKQKKNKKIKNKKQKKKTTTINKKERKKPTILLNFLLRMWGDSIRLQLFE